MKIFQIEQLRLQTFHQTISFTLLEFLKLDNALAFAVRVLKFEQNKYIENKKIHPQIIGAGTSYLVILIQFSMY